MKLILLVLVLFAAAFAQVGDFPPIAPSEPPPGGVRLPNGKRQYDAIAEQDYKRNLEDATALAKLAEDLKDEIEHGDSHVVSVKTIKKTEEIEKLSREIRGRLKRY